MQSKEIQSDFGRYLKGCRINSGRSLDEIAVQTKITMSCLQQLEKEALNHLPQDVFVRGLLKAYADAVGGDTEEALRRYQNCRSLQNKFARDEDITSFGSNFWVRFILALLLFAIAVGITLYGVQKVNSANTALRKSGVVKGEPNPQRQEADQTALGNDTTTPESPTNGPNKLKLKATAVADTRLKIIADGRFPEDYELKSGEQITHTAETNFNVLIINAGGVRLTLNGKQVTVPGKAGQIVTLDLP